MASQKTQGTGSQPANPSQSVTAKEQSTATELDHSPKPMTAWQTIVMTAKVLAGGAAILLLLWLLDKAKG
jgi:hypothetical protein